MASLTKAEIAAKRRASVRKLRDTFLALFDYVMEHHNPDDPGAFLPGDDAEPEDAPPPPPTPIEEVHAPPSPPEPASPSPPEPASPSPPQPASPSPSEPDSPSPPSSKVCPGNWAEHALALKRVAPPTESAPSPKRARLLAPEEEATAASRKKSGSQSSSGTESEEEEWLSEKDDESEEEEWLSEKDDKSEEEDAFAGSYAAENKRPVRSLGRRAHPAVVVLNRRALEDAANRHIRAKKKLIGLSRLQIAQILGVDRRSPALVGAWEESGLGSTQSHSKGIDFADVITHLIPVLAQRELRTLVSSKCRAAAIQQWEKEKKKKTTLPSTSAAQAVQSSQDAPVPQPSSTPSGLPVAWIGSTPMQARLPPASTPLPPTAVTPQGHVSRPPSKEELLAMWRQGSFLGSIYGRAQNV